VLESFLRIKLQTHYNKGNAEHIITNLPQLQVSLPKIVTLSILIFQTKGLDTEKQLIGSRHPYFFALS